MVKRKHIVVNAIHSKTGGGLIFLNHILPYLAKDDRFKVTVLAHKGYVKRIDAPENVHLKLLDVPQGFLKMLLWEQLHVARIAKSIGASITFSVANYAPVFAPNNVLFMTNNPEVRHFVPFKEKLYWYALIWMTRISLLFSKKAITNGAYVQICYASGLFKFLRKKMVEASTACDELPNFEGNKKRQILAIGDYYPHKNYLLLLKSFAKVAAEYDDVQLNIVGHPVRQGIAKEMRSYVRAQGLEKQVNFLGAVPSVETKKMLAESLLYVNPSNAETFSLTLLEAMTLGTASIVKSAAFNKEVAGEKAALYVASSGDHEKDSELWATAICNLLEDGNKRQVIEAVGQNKVKGITWQRTASILISTFDKINMK